MPGVKSVNWDDVTKAKALDALTAFETIRVPEPTLQKIAAYIGKSCTSKAVSTLFTQLGKRKKDQILAAISGQDRDSSSPATSGENSVGTKKAPAQRVISGRVSKPKSAKGKSVKSKSLVKKEDDDDTEDAMAAFDNDAEYKLTPEDEEDKFLSS